MPKESELELRLSYALEGGSDYRVIQALVQRLKDDFVANFLLEDFALILVNDKPERTGYGFLNYLPLFVERQATNKAGVVVAIVDSGKGRQGKRDRQKQFAKIKAECEKKAPQICLADGIAVREMEAWLLADKQALKEVFNSAGKSETLDKIRNPEDEQLPKELLNRIAEELTNGKLTSAAPKLHLLAENIDLAILKQKCPAFAEFAANLLKCLKSWQKSLAERIESWG